MNWLKKRLAQAEQKRLERNVSAVLADPVPGQSSQPQAPPAGSCQGCSASSWKLAFNFVDVTTELAVFAAQVSLGNRAGSEEYARRRGICESCQECDSRGDKLFREVVPGRHSCGVPRWDWIFRDPAREGCGCWLELKWHGKDQVCPLKVPKW
jgi:hypothetical protein